MSIPARAIQAQLPFFLNDRVNEGPVDVHGSGGREDSGSRTYSFCALRADRPSWEREASSEKTSEGHSCLFLATWLQPVIYIGALSHLNAQYLSGPTLEGPLFSLLSPNPGHSNVHPRVMMQSARFLTTGHGQGTPQLHQEMEGGRNKVICLGQKNSSWDPAGDGWRG